MSNSASWMLSSLVFAVACVSFPAHADDLSDCTQPSDMPRAISGCSKLLTASTTPSSFQAIAYRNRSIAHAVMGNFERAEDDFREAIALDPSYWKSAGSDKDDSEQPRASVELSLSEPDNRQTDFDLPGRNR